MLNWHIIVRWNLPSNEMVYILFLDVVCYVIPQLTLYYDKSIILNGIVTRPLGSNKLKCKAMSVSEYNFLVIKSIILLKLTLSHSLLHAIIYRCY